jgi:hypothetical protein
VALLKSTKTAAEAAPLAPKLFRDYLFLYSADTNRDGPINVGLGGSLGLAASSTYTLYLFGNVDGSADQDSEFTPSDGTHVTYASTAASGGGIVVEFTTGAGYVDGTDTVDFVWSNGTVDPTFGVFNGFAITAVPEPSSTALLGLGGLALILRRRK